MPPTAISPACRDRARRTLLRPRQAVAALALWCRDMPAQLAVGAD